MTFIFFVVLTNDHCVVLIDSTGIFVWSSLPIFCLLKLQHNRQIGLIVLDFLPTSVHFLQLIPNKSIEFGRCHPVTLYLLLRD